MGNKLAGKTALITGATRGIGRAIAERFLDEGASIAICATTEDGVAKAVSELQTRSGKVVGRAADVGIGEQVARLLELVDKELGGLDILVNNAGIGRFARVADLSSDDWLQTISTNLTGVYNCCHQALPRLKQRGGGSIINIGSLAGKNPFSGGAAYNASKFGLIGFSEAIFLDHRHDNIRVSNIMPGSVSTDFRDGGGADWKIAPEDIAEIAMMVLTMPVRTMVSQIEVRPSRPRK